MEHLVVVGAQRSGSTYLHNVLAAHPEIAMAQPARPEPKFFLDSEEVEKGVEHYQSKYFSHHTASTRYFGEKSTSYLESVGVASRIHDLLPEARILIILRDPVARALSNYWFSVKNGLETLEFAEALQSEKERAQLQYQSSVNPFAYEQRGRYIEYINNYLQVFDPQQVKLLVFEEFVGNIDAVQDLFSWLGVDDNCRPETLTTVVNRSDGADVDPALLRSLAARFESSVCELEALLDRRLDVWRERWAAL